MVDSFQLSGFPSLWAMACARRAAPELAQSVQSEPCWRKWVATQQRRGTAPE